MYHLKVKGVEPVRSLEKIIQEAERRIMEDETFGGLAISCNIVSAVVEPDGRFEMHGEAALICDILYTHHRQDPRRSIYNA